MSDTQDTGDAQLGGLIRTAGPRTALPADVEERLFRSAHAEWQAALRTRRRTRIAYAAAAGVAALALGAVLLHQPTQDVGAAVVAAVDGEVAVVRDGAPTVASTGATLRAGDVLRTAPHAGVVVRRPDGLEVRLGATSELAWAGTSARLVAGRTYVESHAARADEAPLDLEVRGIHVAHLGTEYAVDASSDAVVVAVRDGAVAVTTATERAVLREGEAAEANGDRIGPLTNGRVVSWAWADALAPSLALDGRPVDEVLAEAAGRAGLSVHYADASVRTRAHDVILRGPGVKLAPRDAIRAVLVAGGFEGEIDGRTVIVRTK